MFIRPRRPRRFGSRSYRSARQRREFVISAYATALVKLALGVSLLICAVQAYRVFHIHAPRVPLTLRLALPVLLAVGAAVALRNGALGIIEARETQAADVDAEGDDDAPPA
jgi:hypothetical protein